MYKWIDADGGVTYSNRLPSEPGAVRDITRIEGVDTGPLDPRPHEAGPAGKEKSSGDNVLARPQAPPPVAPEPATLPRESRAVQREPEGTPRVTRGRTAAVRDPCLTSPDPRCHARYKDRYHPYLGYAPGATLPAAVGTTSPASGSGAVGGEVRR